MATTEIYALDLDDEFLSHLGIKESVQVIRNEKIMSALLEDDEVAQIYEWQIDHYRQHGQPATASVLNEEFGLDLVQPETAIGDLIERLRDRWAVNNTRTYMERVGQAYKADPLSVGPTMLQVGRELQDTLVTIGESVSNGDYGKVIDAYHKRMLAGPGPSLGFDELDTYFHGLKGVVMFIGSPKSYKSWLTANSMLMNILQGKTVYHYSLELPAMETAERLYCLAANVSPWKFLKGSLTREDLNALQAVAEVLDDSGQYQIRKPQKAERQLEPLVEQARDGGADVIYFDQLQYLQTDKGVQLGSGDHKDYWNVLDRARDLSDDGPIVLVHQFNRGTMNLDSMPTMQYAKGAAACEEVCTLIMGMWANKDMRKSGLVEFGAIAARHHMEQSWHVGVNLQNGCQFECLGIAVNDEDEDD